jgi:hypothetical protein
MKYNMSHEQAPQENSQPKMIELPEELMTPEIQQAIEERKTKVGSAGINAARLHEGVVYTDAENFKGDPRRVLGHPSNPTTKLFENQSTVE